MPSRSRQLPKLQAVWLRQPRSTPSTQRLNRLQLLRTRLRLRETRWCLLFLSQPPNSNPVTTRASRSSSSRSSLSSGKHRADSSTGSQSHLTRTLPQMAALELKPCLPVNTITSELSSTPSSRFTFPSSTTNPSNQVMLTSMYLWIQDSLAFRRRLPFLPPTKMARLLRCPSRRSVGMSWMKRITRTRTKPT